LGYPMTYKRVIGRNRLLDGDYQKTPVDWFNSQAGAVVAGLTTDQLEHVVGFWKRHTKEQAETFDRRIQLLAGDLRRLEKDAVDEAATAKAIATRTGVAEDAVALVLKEFMNW
jgi:uncharacterized protein YydD (DUF2326 family)